MYSLGYRNGKFGKIHHKLYKKSKDFVEVDSFKENNNNTEHDSFEK